MYNFYYNLNCKSLYKDFADKVENIINWWLNDKCYEEFKKHDFSSLLSLEKAPTFAYDIEDYISFFSPKNDFFDEFVSYVAENFVKKRDDVTLEYDYIVKNLNYLYDNFEDIVGLINDGLNSFKFFELNSINQSILLLWYIEYVIYKTPKSIILKECILLTSSFSSESSINFVNAVLNKILK